MEDRNGGGTFIGKYHSQMRSYNLTSINSSKSVDTAGSLSF